MNQDMGAPYDPGQDGGDLANLWPPLRGLLGPPSPQLWAWALAQYGQQQGGPAAQAGQGDGAPDGPGQTPAHLVWADAVQNAGRTLPGGAQDGPGHALATSGPSAPAPGADGSGGPPTSAMAAADAPDQNDAPTADAPLADVGPALQPGPDGGAVPASTVAVPAVAKVPTIPTPSGGQAQPQASALNPAGQFLRPELSGGPDTLVAALAPAHLTDNPFGFVVDPKTGSLSRWRVGGDLQHPGQVTLQAVGPREKQAYLEWLTGARANYPLGQVSPEERTKRDLLQQGVLPGAKGPPISAMASGKTVTYSNPEGSTFPLTDNGHPNRDQNPLDLGIGDTARRHGAIGADHSVAIFPSARDAFDASMERMTDIARNHSSSHGQPVGSLANLVYVWSPPEHRQNDTEGMIHDIMRATGFDRNTQWESLTLDQKKAFLRAYGRREGYKGDQLP